jgi:hypothetical protein
VATGEKERRGEKMNILTFLCLIFCPAEIKEIKDIFLCAAVPQSLSYISFISAGQLKTFSAGKKKSVSTVLRPFGSKRQSRAEICVTNFLRECLVVSEKVRNFASD